VKESGLDELRGRAFWVVIGCMACQMGLGLGYVPSQVADGMLADLDWDRTLFAEVFAPQLFAQALASPLAGWMVVRFGIRPVLVGSGLLVCSAFAGLALLGAAAPMMLLAALMGVGLAGVGDVTVGAAVARWVEHARGRALGFVYGGANLGGGLFGILAGAIMVQWNWRVAIAGVAVLALALMLPAALFAVREPHVGEVDIDAGPGNDASETAALGLRQALATRSFWILTWALFAVFFSFVAMTRHLKLLLIDAGLSEADARYFFGNAVLIGVVTKAASGFIADRLHPRRAMIANHALFTASFAVLLALPAAGALALFFVLYAFSANARDVVFPVLVANAFGTRMLAPIYGAICVTLLPGGIGGPIVAGWAFDTTGNYDLALWIFIAVNASALLLLPFVRDETAALARA